MTITMKTIIMKVDEKVPHELDLIMEAEGFGNRTATFNFLVKYYFLTKKDSLDSSIQMLNNLLDKIDTESLPSARDQLKDV
jgi:hypothetical protein